MISKRKRGNGIHIIIIILGRSDEGRKEGPPHLRRIFEILGADEKGRGSYVLKYICNIIRFTVGKGVNGEEERERRGRMANYKVRVNWDTLTIN